MLTWTGSLRVFLALEACDLRLGFDGLSGLVQTRLGEVASSGALFVFTNRRRTRLKLLYFDGTGLWLATKRLEKGTFAWPVAAGSAAAGEPVHKLALTPQALSLLLDGVDLGGAHLRRWYERGS